MPTANPLPAAFSRSLQRFDEKAHAVLETAAVLVGALIEIGRQELFDQPGMRGMQHDAVESGLAQVAGRLPDRRVHASDFILAHRMRRERPVASSRTAALTVPSRARGG